MSVKNRFCLRQNGAAMTYLVICPSLYFFNSEFVDRFGTNPSKVSLNTFKGEGVAGGNTYRYVHDVAQIRNASSVRVLTWGWRPDWIKNVPELDFLIKGAEAP